MARYVDERAWREEVQRTDWYLHVREEYECLLAQARASDRTTARAIADEVYSFFERVLDEREIAVGANGPDWDRERRAADTAVIHHTRLPSGISWRRLDAIHLTRVYARYYADPELAEAYIRGGPISSGHRRDGRDVFYAYHWLIRVDGRRERLLDDHETGWHAGNWDVNCRSVGICLDANLEHADPPEAMLASLVALLSSSYPKIRDDRVFGHREINPNTTCPGEEFAAGWKASLVDRLRQARTR
jgi:hypothetical protein